MEYLGSAIFYFFFVQFLLSYFTIKIPSTLVYLWGAFECIVVGIYWQDTLRNNLFGKFIFERSRFHYMTVQIEQSTLYMIRYCALSAVLFAGLLYGTYRMFARKEISEQQNLARLVGSQFVIVISLVVQVLLNPGVDIVPICASLSILSVVVSMLTDGFFGVKDWGHEWVFEEMEDIYIAVDYLYGFLDANTSAKIVFPQLEHKKDGDILSEEILYIFTAPESVYKVGEKYYERNITEIMNNGKLIGHTILLRDITEQQKMLEMVQSYNTRLKAEVAAKTQHIQLVQDSIITGIASVVESRDNSTGGHINRTSAVVKILAKKLLENADTEFDAEFLNNIIKVAPMHDLGKNSRGSQNYGTGRCV